MSPRTFLPAISVMSSLLLSMTAGASVVVIDGQLVNDGNVPVSLRVANEPLIISSVEEQGEISQFATVSASFSAPTKISISKRGETKEVQLTSTGFALSVRHSGRFASVTLSGTLLTIKADPNRTGQPITDAIVINGRGTGAGAGKILVSQAINVSQDSLPVSNLAGVAIAEPDSTSATNADSAQAVFDAALQRRTADGSNAVRIVVTSSAMRAGIAGTLLRRVASACEQQSVWCLLDLEPSATAGSAPVRGDIQRFLEPDLLDALLEHQNNLMLMLREDDVAAAGASAAVSALRAAGLPHLALLSLDAARAAARGALDPGTLLGTDPYQAIAFTVAPNASTPNLVSHAVPVIVVDAEPVQPSLTTAGNFLIVSRDGITVARVPQAMKVGVRGQTFAFDVGGQFQSMQARAAVNGFFAVGRAGQRKVFVDVPAWDVPAGTVSARAGLLEIKAFHQSGMVVWEYITLKQCLSSDEKNC